MCPKMGRCPPRDGTKNRKERKTNKQTRVIPLIFCGVTHNANSHFVPTRSIDPGGVAGIGAVTASPRASLLLLPVTYIYDQQFSCPF